MDPLDALTEIAYLLERERSSRYKSKAFRTAGDTIANLDPAILFAPWDVVAAEVRDVLARNEGNPRYIFNLGHGVLPETDPSILERVVELVHREGIVRDT